MDPLSITAGSIAIATLCSQCGKCVVSLIQWKGQVKAIDGTIAGFCDEIQSLEQALVSLEVVLNTDSMREVARMAASNDSQVLWRQIERSMSDVRKALTSLETVLERIRKAPSGLFRRPVLQFRTSLESGEIASLRQRLTLLASALNLPLQMLSIFMQAENASANSKNARVGSLTTRVINIESTLERRRRTQTPYASDETAMYANVDELLSSVREFASNASTVSTTASTAPTVTGVVSALPMRYNTESLTGEKLGSEKIANIASWIPLPRATGHASPLVKTASRHSSSFSSPDDEVSAPKDEVSSNTSWSQSHLAASLEEDDLELTILEMRLSKGQRLFHVGRFADAIPFFTKSLESMNAPSLKSKIALTVDDVHLILARIYVSMEHLKDAEELLGPLSDNENQPDSLTLLAAKHLLAEIWTKQNQLDRAQTICFETATRRQKLHGTSSTLFHESARLLIQIYKNQGDKDEAELWEDLVPSPQLQEFIRIAKEIDRIRERGESDKAGDLAIEFLKAYPKEHKWMWNSEKNKLWTDIAMPELRENVMKSSGVGLAGCGYGFTPLHLLAAASSSDCAAEIQYLIDCGVDINCTCEMRAAYGTEYGGFTPLLTATSFENKAAVKVLLKNGANVHLRDSFNITALHHACFDPRLPKEMIEVAKMLLEHGADIEAVDQYGGTPLLNAAFQSSTVMFDFLVASGASQEATTHDGRRLIHIASRALYPALMERLLGSGADIEANDSRNCTPLFHAIVYNRVANVKSLLQRGGNIKVLNIKSQTLLHVAAIRGYLDVTQTLLKFAAKSPEIDLPSWVNAKSEKENTALHYAAAEGHLDVTQALLEFARESPKIDLPSWINAKSEEGLTALHLAAWKGHTAILEKLLDAGARIDLKDNFGFTAFSKAMHGKRDEAVKLLKDRGADPTPCDCDKCIAERKGKKKDKRKA